MKVSKGISLLPIQDYMLLYTDAPEPLSRACLRCFCGVWPLRRVNALQKALGSA